MGKWELEAFGRTGSDAAGDSAADGSSSSLPARADVHRCPWPAEAASTWAASGRCWKCLTGADAEHVRGVWEVPG